MTLATLVKVVKPVTLLVTPARHVILARVAILAT